MIADDEVHPVVDREVGNLDRAIGSNLEIRRRLSNILCPPMHGRHQNVDLAPQLFDFRHHRLAIETLAYAIKGKKAKLDAPHVDERRG